MVHTRNPLTLFPDGWTASAIEKNRDLLEGQALIHNFSEGDWVCRRSKV